MPTPDDLRPLLALWSRLTPQQRTEQLDAMRPSRKATFRWLLQARPAQLAPAGDWAVWLILAGRGWGKTRSAAEWVAQQARANPGSRVALVAATFSDGRDTMVEGESGLLACLTPEELSGSSIDHAWNRSIGELQMANGSQFKVYSSEKPRQLRGPQHHFGWADEVAQWDDARLGTQADTTWSNLLFTCRLGAHPRIVVATTPRPVSLLRARDGEPAGLTQQTTTVVTRGTTMDNLANLAPTYRANVIEPLQGTRLGRQELDGELIEDVEGALWSTETLGRARLRADQVPDRAAFTRIVVGVDPSVSSGARADLTGIVVVGLMTVPGQPQPVAVVLDDRSLRASPGEWSKRVVKVFDDWRADKVIAEANQGGDMVRDTLRTVRSSLPVDLVHATRGKRLRAEPVAALYEQGRVRHAGAFPELEEQMTTWTPEEPGSPDRLDALVWACASLLPHLHAGRTSVTSPAGIRLPGRFGSRGGTDARRHAAAHEVRRVV